VTDPETILILLVGQQKGQLVCESTDTKITKSVLFGTGLTWSNCGNGLVKQKKTSVCVIVICLQCFDAVHWMSWRACGLQDNFTFSACISLPIQVSLENKY